MLLSPSSNHIKILWCRYDIQNLIVEIDRTQEKLLIWPAFKLETWCTGNTAIDCFFCVSWMSGSCSTLCVSDDSFCVSNGSLCDSDTFLCVSVSVMAVCDSYNYLIYVNYYTVCFSDNSFTCVFSDNMWQS